MSAIRIQKPNDVHWPLTHLIPTRTHTKLLHTSPEVPSFLLLGKPYKQTLQTPLVFHPIDPSLRQNKVSRGRNVTHSKADKMEDLPIPPSPSLYFLPFFFPPLCFDDISFTRLSLLTTTILTDIQSFV